MLLSIGTGSAGLQAQGPAGGVVRAGDVQIAGEGTASVRINQQSARGIIDWRSFSIGANGEVVFVQPSAQAATLNRVTGEQVSVILGKLDANGHVLLINPNGVVFGAGSQVNVGSLIATTSNISDANFMAGHLVFDQPGQPGAGIWNAGTLTARDGGLVALVAPHVRNDGLIAARLGTVVLGSADTFTVDLYGDALINLALRPENAGQLRALNGEPVTSLITNTGRIETAGGQTVLITARNAKNVLDNLINMSGTIKADTALAQDGKILLLGEGGTVDVTGTLTAAGATGGSIQVLGDQVHLAGSAALDASGAGGGGVIQVGGAFQGGGDTYRSTATRVDAGARLTANATDTGHGGQVVVWSDGHTNFAGAVEAKGGATSGNGGQLEVSGKGTLDFLGTGDASAANGQAGSLLLDPTIMTIGATEASNITRVLRTGTTATLQADVDINVNSAISGGDRTAGGGLTMTAGHDINVNDFIVTNNGAINMTAQLGTVTVAPGKAVFAGTAPISVTTGGTVHTAPMLTSGALSIQSLAGSVAVDSFIDDHTGPVSLKAAGNIDINQPIVNMVSGSDLTVTAGQDVNVNAQVDGRGNVAGGAVNLTAARNVSVNQAVVTNSGPLTVTASNGAITTASGAALVSGAGPLTLTSRGDLSTGALDAGTLAISSTGGSVSVNGFIDSATGVTTIAAAADVNVNQPILNGQTGSALTIDAGRDVNVNAVIEGRGGAAGGAVTIGASRSIAVNDHVLTNDGAQTLTASNGAITVAGGKSTLAGAAAIVMKAAGDVTTGAVSAGSFSAASTGGNVSVNAAIVTHDGAISLSAVNGTASVANAAGLFAGSAPISVDALGNISTGTLNGGVTNVRSRGGSVSVTGQLAGTGGAMTIAAAGHVDINNAVTNPGTSSPLAISAGTDINVNAAVGRTGPGVQSSTVTLTAGQNVNLNDSIVTGNAAITVTATNGTVHTATTEGLFAGNGNITVQSGQTLSTPDVTTTGAVTLKSTAGSVNIDKAINPETGPITIEAFNDVNVNRGIANPLGTSPLNVTAGHDINVNAKIDGRDDVLSGPSGAIALTADHNINLNDDVIGVDTPVSITATTGTVNWASGKGLYAGTGAIAVSSGGDLTTGLAVNTGGLALTSTGGDVNVATAIGETIGDVTIDAAHTVNVNQSIANLKSGGNLAVDAGADININAKVDGLEGVATGGAVRLTAGHDLTLTSTIATNNGAVSLAATTGSVTLPTTYDGNGSLVSPTGWSVSAGSGPIDVTSGGDFTLTSSLQTSGALNITSTTGDVTVAAPIGGDTGAVTIVAADALVISHQVKSADKDITLTAGAGGITVNAVNDGSRVAPVNAGGGNLTMTSVGSVTINDARGIASMRDIAIDTQGFLSGQIGETSSDGGTPRTVTLKANEGMSFIAGYANRIDATALNGSIALTAYSPDTLRVTTGTPGTQDCSSCDIRLDGNLGHDAVLDAGGSINLSTFSVGTGTFVARSGDLNLGSAFAGTITGTAARDVVLTGSMDAGGALVFAAGRDFVAGATSKIRITGGGSLTVTANRNLSLFLLETLGGVSLTATTGDIVVNNDLGPHYSLPGGGSSFNPADLGVAWLVMSAPAAGASIAMAGARAEGDITITSGGDLTAAAELVSVHGTRTLNVAGTVTLNDNVPIATVQELLPPTNTDRSVIPPSPRFASSPNPGVPPTPVAPGLPPFAEIPVSLADQAVGSVSAPRTSSGSVGAPTEAAALAGVTPGTPTGSTPGEASASSDAGTADTAAALRTAGESCGEQGSGDTGLNDLEQKDTKDASSQQKASCSVQQ